jgi:hypothetical protein
MTASFGTGSVAGEITAIPLEFAHVKKRFA